ncbi:DUF6745 domain-containing protein [Sphaerisporangium sp. NPDC049003]|uniref:DUF6745 domain-containing protein n=1 Tax=Sphaerisporangium sp. NPDC049003 TaxID=3364517 RepID=UPI003719E116
MNAQASQAFAGAFTEEHEAVVAEVRDEWRRSGLSTDPPDRGAAEQAVREAYAAASLEPPRRVVWAGSPAGCLRACVDDETIDQPRLTPAPELESRLRGELRRRYRSHPWSELEDRLEGRLRGELGTGLWDELRSEISSRIREPLLNQLRVQLRGHVLSRLGHRLPSVLYGCLSGVQDIWRDAYWMALYTCALRIAGMRPDERLETLVRATRHLGWWIPSGEAVIVSERPAVLHRDELSRLHCATGPALSWPDGYALHAWHGTPVPAWVVEDPTPEAIKAEADPETRRCAIESFGWERYITEAGMPLVTETEDPRPAVSRPTLSDVRGHVLDEPLRALVTAEAHAGGMYLLL